MRNQVDLWDAQMIEQRLRILSHLVEAVMNVRP
jgi:hypothetical protein